MISAHDVDAFETDEPAPRERGRRHTSPKRRIMAVRPSPAAGQRAAREPVARDGNQQALARLLALSLLANGRMKPCEVEVLCDDGGLAQLGLSESEFFQVLYEFCADVERMPALGGGYVISRDQVQGLLDEITDTTLRERTLDIMYQVMRSDGRLDEGELALLMATLHAWDDTRRFPGQSRFN